MNIVFSENNGYCPPYAPVASNTAFVRLSTSVDFVSLRSRQENAVTSTIKIGNI